MSNNARRLRDLEYRVDTLARQRNGGWNMSGCVCATTIVAAIIAIVAIIMGTLAFVRMSNIIYAQSYVVSGPIRPSPYTIHLDATAAPQAMTLPDDLSDWVGREYAILSGSDQPHTVTIEAGSLGTTWDGVNKVATFGGAKGDGIMFHVIAKDLITVTFTKNIVLS